MVTYSARRLKNFAVAAALFYRIADEVSRISNSADRASATAKLTRISAAVFETQDKGLNGLLFGSSRQRRLARTRERPIHM